MKRMTANRGSALMEFVIVMPMLIVLLMLVLQFALVWIAREQTAYAAYCAARSSLSYNPVEQQSAAENAAYLALSWVNGASAGGGSSQIPGWGNIPNSGGMRNWVRVRLGNRQGRRVATVTYDYPLGVPIASLLISAANAGNNSEIRMQGWIGTPAYKNGYPYMTLTETCVLPAAYADDNLPIGGLL